MIFSQVVIYHKTVYNENGDDSDKVSMELSAGEDNERR